MKFIMNDVDDSTNIYYLDLNNDENYELKIIVYHRHIYGREGLSDYEVGSAGSSPNSWDHGADGGWVRRRDLGGGEAYCKWLLTIFNFYANRLLDPPPSPLY